MRLVIARCTVDYDGRLTAHLPEAVRLLMVKADGCVSIHADGGAYKPLNWMNSPNTLTIDEDKDGGNAEAVWTVRNPGGEMLTIILHEVLSDASHEMGLDPGLRKDGVEAHLQALLAADIGHRGRRAAPGPPRVPHRHRPGRPALPGCRRRGGGHRGEASG